MQFLKYFFSRLKFFIIDADFTTADLILSFNLIGWGLWLRAPFDTFANSFIYNDLIKIASENTWGLALILLGIVRLIVLMRDKNRERIVCIALSMFFWVFFFAVFLHQRPTGSITYFMLFFSVVSAWELFRIVRKYRLRKLAVEQLHKDLYGTQL